MTIFKNTIFKNFDSSAKIKIWLLVSIVLSMVLIYSIGYIFGLLGASMAMLLSLIVGIYIIDNYGDCLFKDIKNIPTIDQLDSYKRQPFPYHSYTYIIRCMENDK